MVDKCGWMIKPEKKRHAFSNLPGLHEVCIFESEIENNLCRPFRLGWNGTIYKSTIFL